MVTAGWTLRPFGTSGAHLRLPRRWASCSAGLGLKSPAPLRFHAVQVGRHRGRGRRAIGRTGHQSCM